MSPGGISWGAYQMISLQVRFLLWQRKAGREGLIDGIPLLTSQSHPSPDSFICLEVGWKEEGEDGESIDAEWREHFHDL